MRQKFLIEVGCASRAEGDDLVCAVEKPDVVASKSESCRENVFDYREENCR
jgi:hypothetical protein